METEKRRTERDIEAEQGGPGVYSCDLRKNYVYVLCLVFAHASNRLDHDEWKWDLIPEIMDGHNIADFVDPEIDARLAELEREEDALEAAAADTGDMVPPACT
jgi:nucleolar GTP-binding protein